MQEDVLRLILNNVRLPEMNRADLFAIVAGCRAGEKRVIELCERFGKDVYLAALQALLDRTHEAMRKLILMAIPEEPQSFEDWIDDDGLGNGPYKMKLTIWREGEHAWFDWSGTDPQALGPINFYLSEGMFKMFIGVYLIMVNDPQILFNDGFYPLLHVVMPEGCLLAPRYPAALGCRTHGLTRLFDVLGGALCKQAPELNTAAGYGTSPYMLYSGWKEDGEFFYAMEILYGGIPGRPIGDGMDGHSWWPLFENIPTEYLEAYYPLRIDGYTTVTDSGGAGLHRGGNGVEKRYVYLEPGHVSIHDDRWLTRPWGVLGGEPGERSTKLLRRADGTEQVLPAKCDEVEVQPGDMLIYRTAGGGGWKDRLDRPVEAVERDVAFGLVSPEKALLGSYGVVVGDAAATEAERARQRAERGEAKAFDFGPELADVLANCEAETGPGAAAAGDAAALVAARVAATTRGRACARPGRRRSRRGTDTRERGVRRRPRVRGAPRRGRRRPRERASPIPRRRSAPTSTRWWRARATLLDGAREAGVPVLFTTVVYDEANERAAAVFLRKVPALAVLRPGSRWIEVDERLGRRDDEPVLVEGVRVGVLRHAAGVDAGRARHAGRVRGEHVGLRARDGRRRAPARAGADRPARVRRRPLAGRARGEPVRHRGQVRRRGVAVRRGRRDARGRAAGGRERLTATRRRRSAPSRSTPVSTPSPSSR